MELSIVICTYRRPQILDTLKSLAEQELPADVTFNVIVVDNDEQPIAKTYIEDIAQQFNLAMIYVHAPYRNISIARNAGFKNRTSDCLLTIDDDQIVSKNWIVEILRVARITQADVVFGPVKAIYNELAADWIKRGDFHSHEPVYVNGIIKTGYTGNVLLKLNSPVFDNEFFDLHLGQSGGEDSDYFSRVFSKGAKLVFAKNAVVFESIPENRSNLTWLLQRQFRIGQTYASTIYLLRKSHFYSYKIILKTSLKFFLCCLMTCICALWPELRYKWLLRGWLHLGVVAKLLGKKNIELY